jgi:hypothetical protein
MNKLGKWKPASGHPGGWRVVRSPGLNCLLEELSGKTGRRVLFKGIASAQAKADELNAVKGQKE